MKSYSIFSPMRIPGRGGCGLRMVLTYAVRRELNKGSLFQYVMQHSLFAFCKEWEIDENPSEYLLGKNVLN